MTRQRGIMALIGAMAGGSIYLLGRAIEANWLAGRPAVAVAVFAVVFFAGVLITAGPLPVRRAALGAAAVALTMALLLTLSSLRFQASDDVAGSVLPMFSIAALGFLPWPFLIAQDGLGWRDYPTLFSESWGIVVRVTVATIFTCIVWLVIYLSQALLDLVGVGVIGLLLRQDVAPWLITGTVLGLAMAVVNEMADVLSPGLVLRLFRLLVPVVLVVMVIFLVALPLRGFGGILGAVSSTAVLLGMVAVAVTLVTAALDQEDAMAAHSGLMVQAARLLTAIEVVPAGLAAWALGLRVAQHGWTPDRLLAATAVVLALAYGLLYLAAVLRGAGWMERVRQANIWMALASMGVSVLWLTVLNPESISASSQMARIADGRTKVADIDLYAFQNWGLAGQSALDRLKELAKTDATLAARLASGDAAGAPATAPLADLAGLQKALAAVMPVQPDTPQAQDLRAKIFAQVAEYDLQRWQAACDAHLPAGGPGCVLVVADFLPLLPGDEAMLLARDPDGSMVTEGLALTDGVLSRHLITSYGGILPDFAQGALLIDGLQKGPSPVHAVPLNQLDVPGQPGLLFAP